MHFMSPLKTRPKTAKTKRKAVEKAIVLLILAVNTSFLMEELFFFKAITPNQRAIAEKNREDSSLT